MTKCEQDFQAAHRLGDRRQVCQAGFVITQVFTRDGWWNIKIEVV